MPQISARLSDNMVDSLDRAARTQRRSRADIIRKAIEYYLNDLEKVNVSLQQTILLSDVEVDWEQAKRVLNYDIPEKHSEAVT